MSLNRFKTRKLNKNNILAYRIEIQLMEYGQRVKELEKELEFVVIDENIENNVKYQEKLTLSRVIKDFNELLDKA